MNLPGTSMTLSVSLSQYELRNMETRHESSSAPLGPEAAPAEGQHIDLTEDLAQQLEDIISTYQDAEIPAEPEDGEEVTSIKEANARKDQKLEKKMLKNLGWSFVDSLSEINVALTVCWNMVDKTFPQISKMIFIEKISIDSNNFGFNLNIASSKHSI